MLGKELLSKLVEKGCKFTEDDIVFIAIDSMGKLVWLENGNKNAGLNHIVLNHNEDFDVACGVKADEIAFYLYAVITKGTVIACIPSKVKGGLDRIYEYDGNYYTFVGMGDNGFIVTSFPTRK